MVLRIFKMIASSGFVAALQCTIFIFGRGSAPDAAGELTALPRPLAGLRGHNKLEKEIGEGERETNGRGRQRDGPAPTFENSLDPPLT